MDLATAETYLDSIQSGIRTAIACKAYLKQASAHNANLHRKINNTKYANVTNLIWNAIQQDLLLCVTKVWDQGAGAKSLTKIRESLDWAQLESSISSKPQELGQIAAITKFTLCVDTYTKGDRYNSLLVSRTEGFAHTVTSARVRSRMTVPRTATLNDIHFGLETAIEAYSAARRALGLHKIDFSFLEGQFQKISDQFFEEIPDINGPKLTAARRRRRAK
ncbi:MAG: hypothetical protein O3A08_10740 [Proteobacteria bacterium]|nr:hypothetical protein [Pseudomonadota bacterium]